jgi:predicted phage-related endonuclease
MNTQVATGIGDTIALDAGTANFIAEFIRLRAEITRMEKEKDLMRDLILEAMGDAALGTHDGVPVVKITEVAQDRVRSMKDFREAFPEAYAAVTHVTVSRRVVPQ